MMFTKEKALAIKPLMENEDFCKELIGAETDEAQCRVFEKYGVTLDTEDLKAIADAVDTAKNEAELNEDDLEQVAGGFGAVVSIVVYGVVLLVSLAMFLYLTRQLRSGASKSSIVKAIAKKSKTAVA